MERLTREQLEQAQCRGAVYTREGYEYLSSDAIKRLAKTTLSLMDEVDEYVKNKDELTGKLIRWDTVLRQARATLKNMIEEWMCYDCSTDKQIYAMVNDAIKSIDELEV